MKKQGMNQLNNVAIYCRLSHDDGSIEESVSIQNQRNVLREYVEKNNWIIYKEYIDDGYSGTNYARPAFQEMICDIERGMIQIVITKDLSRLGRNYLQTGYYTEEYFPLKKVRYIAVNDNFDTEVEEGNEIVPFKNLINEWYARDISKKIRFTVSNKMKNGEFSRTVVPLYGYNQTENSRIINEDTAPIVKYIFEEYLSGITSRQICENLLEARVYTPSVYNFYKFGYRKEKYIDIDEAKKYAWTPIMIIKILEKEEYTGAYIRGKRETKFKRKGANYKSKDNWYIFNKKYEPIVTENQFELCKKIRLSRQREKNSTFKSPLKGKCYCGYCGAKLRVNRRSEKLNKESGVWRFSCSNKHEKGSASINDKELDTIIKSELTALKFFLLERKEQFLDFMEKHKNAVISNQTIDLQTIELERLKKRESELNNYLEKAFESYANKILSKDSYEMLTKKYIKEKNELMKRLQELQNNSTNNDNQVFEASLIIEYFEKYSSEELFTARTINFLISKIVIKSYGKLIHHCYNMKKIDIYYNFCDSLIKDFVNEAK